MCMHHGVSQFTRCCARMRSGLAKQTIICTGNVSELRTAVLRAKVPVRILLNFYYVGPFVHPHLLYAVEVYGNTKLSKLNKKLLRILQHKPFRSHIPHILNSLHYQLLFFVNSNY